MLKKLILYRMDVVATGVLSLIIFVLALAPHAPAPATTYGDKLNHLVAFGALVLPIGLLRRRMLWKAAGYSIALGAVIEIVQPITGRNSELYDFIADIIGVGLAVLIVLVLDAMKLGRRDVTNGEHETL